MRASLGLLLVLAGASGCAGRYNTLSSGTYACTATLTTNTCAETLPETYTYTSPLQGGGTDTFAIQVPSSVSRSRGEISTEDVQFGIHADPNRYSITSGSLCRSSTGGPGSMPVFASTAIDAQLTSIGDDALEIHLTFDYPDFADCPDASTMSGPCQMVWDVDCALAP